MKKVLLILPVIVVALAVAGAVLQARHRAELAAQALALYQKVQRDQGVVAQREAQLQQLQFLLHKYMHREPDRTMYWGLYRAVFQQLLDASRVQEADQRVLDALLKRLRR